MTRTRASTITYWALTIVFALVLMWTVIGLFVDGQGVHWRYVIWWVLILGAHLARTPILIVIWIAFLFDLFDPMMRFLYASQGPEIPFLIIPFLILAPLIYLWRRAQYTRSNFSEGDPNG